MKINLALIISDSNDSAFKSKSRKESHNVLGQSIEQWSQMALMGLTQDTLSLSYNEIDKCKNALEKADTVIINWADQPLILGETISELLNQHYLKNVDASGLFGLNDKAAIYIFDSKIFLQKLEKLNLKILSRDILKEVYKSIDKNNNIISKDNNQLKVVEDRISLAEVTNQLKLRILNEIMLSGVTLIDPLSTYIDYDVKIGMDTVIMPNTIIGKGSVIGEDSIIGPNSRISNCKIGNNVEVANSVAIDSCIGDETHVGPFAYLRPGSMVGSNVKIGDFVEVKKSVIGDKTKISHLTYVGDAEVGSNVNIGCGVVFVNYDGKHKNKTIVGDNSFIGCNTNLVSPVTVHNDTYIAAGSTITEDVPENSLAIARERQTIKQDWVIKKDMKRK